MKAIGKLVDLEPGQYTARDNTVVQQLTAQVLTDESELVSVRASGDKNIAAMQNLLKGVEALGPCTLPCTSPREFGGRTVWQFVAPKSR